MRIAAQMLKKTHVASLFGLLLLLTPAWASAWETHRIALLIANNQSGGREKLLHYAVSDARKMRDVLMQVSGYSHRDIFTVFNQNAAAVRRMFQMIRLRVQRFKRDPKARVELFVYYAGHARRGHLLLGATDLSFKELRTFIKGSGATLRLAFLDTCGSGQFLQARGPKHHKHHTFRLSVLNSHQTRGEAIITATGTGRNAYEDNRLKSGVFTHYLVTGLRGAADRNRDGRVTLNELYQYTYSQTLHRTIFAQKGPQKPHYYKYLEGAGHLILSSTTDSQTILSFHPRLAGRFFVWNQRRDVLYAGFFKKPGHTKQLALVPGSYEIQWRHQERNYSAHIQLQQGKRLELQEKQGKLGYITSPIARGGGGGEYTSQPSIAQAWNALPNRSRSPWELTVQGGVLLSSFSGGQLLAGGVLGLQHLIFDINLGFWGQSVLYADGDYSQMLIELSLGVGYTWQWSFFLLTLRGYVCIGMLLQDVNKNPSTGWLFRYGARLIPAFQLAPHWTLGLVADISHIPVPQIGARIAHFVGVGLTTMLRYRF